MTEPGAAVGNDTQTGYCEVGVDVGGTFTDVVLVSNDGLIDIRKLLSSPPDLGRGVVAGVRAALTASGLGPAAIARVFNGTTVASNAVLERTGSDAGVVTTKGFRDVLELGTGRRPTTYDLLWEKPRPLARRRHRLELDHRITASGALERRCGPEDLDELAAQIKASGVTSFAVSLINSHVRPDEERRIVAELAQRCPGVTFTTSVDLAPERGEFARVSTAVVNAYVHDVVNQYLSGLSQEFDAMDSTAPMFVMQSSGGLLDWARANEHPVRLMESGPAAGVVAARELTQRIGVSNGISFDMGGTTAKAALIEDGQIPEASDYEIGAGMNVARGFGGTGGGYLIRVASLDIAEIGAGGGSEIWIDRGNAPRVGPASAGASPGPACYGLGGERPTLSDACVALGYFNQHSIAGGTQLIHPELAQRALRPIADRLGIDVQRAAYGAIRIATENMTQLVRAVTTQRGRDPRTHALVAFGGSGPAYACGLASSLGISRIVVPPAPGVFSALGLTLADPQHEAVQHNTVGGNDYKAISDSFATLTDELVRRLTGTGYDRDEIELSRWVEMRYKGQRGTLKVAVPRTDLGADDLDDLLVMFAQEHEKTYGHAKDASAIEIATLRVRAVCRRRGKPDFLRALAEKIEHSEGHPGGSRATYFGPAIGVLDTPVVNRHDISAAITAGPIIVEELDATTVIPPWAAVHRDDLGNLLIDITEDV